MASLRFLGNKRSEDRTKAAGMVLWKPLGKTKATQTGWALDASKCGVAFAWRGDSIPLPGSLIELSHGEIDASGHPSRRAIVRRTSIAHGDLVIIAAEYLRMRSFPPAKAEAEIEVCPVQLERVGCRVES